LTKAQPQTLGCEGALEPLEVVEDLLCRWLGRRCDQAQPAPQIGHDQRFLGREVVVKRTFANADFGGDGVDPRRPDALAVEQPVGSLKNALGHRPSFRCANHITPISLLRNCFR